MGFGRCRFAQRFGMFPSLESLPDLPRLVTVAKPRLVYSDFQAWLSEGSIGEELTDTSNGGEHVQCFL